MAADKIPVDVATAKMVIVIVEVVNGESSISDPDGDNIKEDHHRTVTNHSPANVENVVNAIPIPIINCEETIATLNNILPKCNHCINSTGCSIIEGIPNSATDFTHDVENNGLTVND